MKRKIPAEQIKEKSPTPKHEISVPEHEVSKTSEAPKKPEAPKLKGIVFKSPAQEQIDAPPAPVEGKGKGEVVELPCPSIKQNLIPLLEQRQMIPDPEVITRKEVDLQQHLSLYENAGASGQAIAVDMMSWMAQSLNVVGIDLCD